MNGIAPSLDAYRAGYHILETRERNDRRRPHIEITDEGDILSTIRRLESTGQLRDLQRNYAQAKSLINQMVRHVVGTGPKVLFHTKNEKWNSDAAHWFNSVWAANCDGRDDLHFAYLCELAVGTVLREHDCVCFFDGGGLVDEGAPATDTAPERPSSAGRLFFWEGDQISNLEPGAFKNHVAEIAAAVNYPADKISQDRGVLKTEYGRVLGWIASHRRGLGALNWEDVTVLPIGPAWMLKDPWRLNDARGTSALLASAAMLIDDYELLKIELLSAKRAAGMAAKVKSADPSSRAMGRSDSATKPKVTDAAATDRYEILEKVFGGAVEYLNQGDDIEILENRRPAPQLADFLNFSAVQAGAGFGLPRLYSLLQADASYSASRAEMNVGDVTFKRYQKWLERQFLDRVLDRALAWGVSVGAVPERTAMWRGEFSWEHHKQEPIDENKHESANRTGLEIGSRTMKDIHGAEWRNVIRQRAAERVAERVALQEAAAAAGITIEPEENEDAL